jgi:ribonuclease HI
MTSKKYYAVFKGRKTGLFTSWADCDEQISGFSGALYKSFKTRGEAEAALGLTYWPTLFPIEQKEVEKKTQNVVPASELILDSVCVDASCIRNPGDVEYRGIYTATREVIFHKQPMLNGTNNIGEFLAVVHALAHLKNQKSDIPVYSDSETAIIWVRNKRVRTKLERKSNNEEIFNLLERGLKWLENNEYANPLLKWDTVSWGEIPADFGRKRTSRSFCGSRNTKQ